MRSGFVNTTLISFLISYLRIPSVAVRVRSCGRWSARDPDRGTHTAGRPVRHRNRTGGGRAAAAGLPDLGRRPGAAHHGRTGGPGGDGRTDGRLRRLPQPYGGTGAAACRAGGRGPGARRVPGRPAAGRSGRRHRPAGHRSADRLGRRTTAAAAPADPLFAGAPGRLRVLHWHRDTMDLPAEAILLASCDRYPVQAFRIGRSAWGTQFQQAGTSRSTRTPGTTSWHARPAPAPSSEHTARRPRHPPRLLYGRGPVGDHR